jgi:hypothetical protein
MLKLLCTVIDPVITGEMFNEKDETVNLGFREQLEKQLGKTISDDEFEKMMMPKSEKEDFDEVTSTVEE